MTRVGPNGRPTIEDFREMKYLRAVLNGAESMLFFKWRISSDGLPETLRLYPPVCVCSMLIGTSYSYSSSRILAHLTFGKPSRPN
jgi:hypothetical protein